MEHQSRGLYFDDFEIGQKIITSARTVTSTDIVNFACLSGDFNDVHTNHEYCKTTQWGQPLAHGPLVYAIMAGLQYATGVNDGTLLALLEVERWRMLSPVVHGDTIHVVSTVLDKKEASKPDRGVVTFERVCVKQDGTIAQQLTTKALYRRRASAQAA
ncbi:MaoC/PaaZ C-terminal domain-containing protein [Aquabacter sp. CN5-332]|uniref:MaoC/PaaZ C-terminal domain-containing protein n=1 Tax=Aquabacter sp. CN5-332 TaxID=3156608 RepID=UPI0032B5DEB7